METRRKNTLKKGEAVKIKRSIEWKGSVGNLDGWNLFYVIFGELNKFKYLSSRVGEIFFLQKKVFFCFYFLMNKGEYELQIGI